MKTAIFAICLAACCCVPALANKRKMETGKVISQNVGAYNGGSIATATGTNTSAMAVGMPVLRAMNTVIVENSQRRLTLVEITGRNYLLLTVNGTVSYYQDGNRVFIEDAKHKKHKFFVTRMEDISQEK